MDADNGGALKIHSQAQHRVTFVLHIWACANGGGVCQGEEGDPEILDTTQGALSTGISYPGLFRSSETRECGHNRAQK